MPWPAVLPIAIMAMIYGVMLSKRQEQTAIAKRLKALKKEKKGQKDHGK